MTMGNEVWMDGTHGTRIWMDGTIVDWGEARVHILTHTLNYGPPTGSTTAPGYSRAFAVIKPLVGPRFFAYQSM